MNTEQNRQAQVVDERMAPAQAEEMKRIVRDASHPPMFPRMCLSCGARETLDGSVPCGH
ncbi:hypothetical protein KDX23_17530 [Burkholderia vietnamiensis]|uniref:hypothetical protein n=1 Tax=Burkholderia vietnamiensis TaxID=60552 RepID=UPI001B941601|nr:hypothetical protein [Burkholderia vietnamiensis]MBR8084539.1 hypothetical protein [Burkholderia vietnamiensis]